MAASMLVLDPAAQPSNAPGQASSALDGLIKALALELGPCNIRAIDRLSSRRYSC